MTAPAAPSASTSPSAPASTRGRRRADEDAMLDAAMECVLAFGVRRTTLSDVARRANLSRMTLYRRWPDVDSLVTDLITRECGVVTARAAQATEKGDGPLCERMIDQIVSATQELRAHPLLRKIIDVDPELLLPYLLRRRGASQNTILDFLTAAIAHGQQEGTIRQTDPGLLARTVLLAVQSFVLSAEALAEPAALADIDAQLTLLLRNYLKA